ncbi:MAG TPA: hypothetical protein VJ884_03435, partial [Salinibacter sp.]|nr:hypothetical protein [Salinibacter sp.]
AMMGGEGDVAVEAAEKIDANRTEDMIEVERLRPVLVYALVRFEKWDDVLALPAPPEEQLYARAMWHYGRGLAKLHTTETNAATDDLNALTAIAESAAAQELEQPFFYGLSQVQIAQRLLQGEIAREAQAYDVAVRHLRAAVKIQDGLPYMEPPYWFYPVRQTLGAALLAAGRYAEAEAIYREDLDYFAENGWSLHGLGESLRAQGRIAEADAVQKRFEQAWQHADLPLAKASSSSF